MIDPYYVMEKAPQWGNNHLLNGNFSIVLTPVKGLTITSLNGIDGNYSTYTFTGLPSHFASGVRVPYASVLAVLHPLDQ